MKNQLADLVLLFFLYSFAGWCMEVVLKYIQYHRFINRGFLTGPVCPIYGAGASLITVSLGLISPNASIQGWIDVFAVSFVLCGLVEYLTSYVLELIFHARWWDYSQKPMNLHGRVWIGNLLLFGAAGVGIVYLFNPLIHALFSLASLKVREFLAAAFGAVFIADFVVSFFVLRLVKTYVEKSEADNTEEVSSEVRLLLHNRSYFHARFADAYPEVVYKTERINARLAEVKAEAERLHREAEERVAERREQMKASLQPTSVLRAEIIDRQAALIDLLYDDATASPKARSLKAAIDDDTDRLNSRSPLRKRL